MFIVRPHCVKRNIFYIKPLRPHLFRFLRLPCPALNKKNMHLLVPFGLIKKVKIYKTNLFRIFRPNRYANLLLDLPDHILMDALPVFKFSAEPIPLTRAKTPLFHTKKNFSFFNKKAE